MKHYRTIFTRGYRSTEINDWEKEIHKECGTECKSIESHINLNDSDVILFYCLKCKTPFAYEYQETTVLQPLPLELNDASIELARRIWAGEI